MICKICNAEAHFFEAVDVNKNCGEHAGLFLPKLGVPVEYFQCSACQFLFTSYFDSFSDDDWQRVIYNNDYVKVDPLYPEIRPQANAQFFRLLMDSKGQDSHPKVIDYGAGNGKFAEILKDDFQVTSFDPHQVLFSRMPDKKFDIIFSSEVLEHTVSPLSVAKDWKALLREHGVVLFSTMIQPDNMADIKASWWYVSPRNGHVSIYSVASLHALFEQVGMQYQTLSSEWHIAFHDGAKPPFDFVKWNHIVQQLPTGFIALN